MDFKEFVGRLQNVRSLSPHRVTASCPAHRPDRSRSFSAREADDERILVRCFAACSAAEICEALGLSLRDLFPNSTPHDSRWCEQRRAREEARRQEKQQGYLEGLRIDACRKAERFGLAARNIDISDWSVEQVDEAMLSPYCSRIELKSLPRKRDESRMLYSMGWETANVHLGTRRAVSALLTDTNKRTSGWLRTATKRMNQAILRDWKDWRKQ